MKRFFGFSARIKEEGSARVAPVAAPMPKSDSLLEKRMFGLLSIGV